MKKKGVKTKMKKKLLLIIGVLTIALCLMLAVPRAKAAEGFDDTAHYKGFIEGFETEIINGNEYIIGAWVFIEETSLPEGTYSRYYYFGLEYFQPDLTVLADEMIGRKLIWNPFDIRGPLHNGAWWLLLGYEYISDNIEDAFQYGYLSGYNNGYLAGEQEGYENGYDEGYSIGYNEGELEGWNEGYNEGYQNGYNDAYNEIIDEDEYILGYNNGFKDGEKSKIVRNNEAFYSGIQKWLVPAIIVVIVLGGIMSISALKRRET